MEVEVEVEGRSVTGKYESRREGRRRNMSPEYHGNVHKMPEI